MYIKNRKLICENIDNVIIIFDPESELFFEIQDSGSLIWNTIEEYSVDEIAQLVCEQYCVDYDVALSDTQIFINALLEKSFLIENKQL